MKDLWSRLISAVVCFARGFAISKLKCGVKIRGLIVGKNKLVFAELDAGIRASGDKKVPEDIAEMLRMLPNPSSPTKK